MSKQVSWTVGEVDWKRVVAILSGGGIIAYPTEGVYGLGCDPFNREAVERLLQIKQRDRAKGLILIAADWSQVQNLIAGELADFPRIFQETDPTTWVFPATATAPSWICGDFPSIALRVTTHPEAAAICQQWGGAIVSTSANNAGEPPAMAAHELSVQISSQVELILPGKVGTLSKPTTIRDARTGEVLRF